MKALIKKEATAGIYLVDHVKPNPSLHEVLIKVLRTSLCGTDLQLYNSSDSVLNIGNSTAIMGHEFIGEIVDLCPSVKGYECGQLVSGETQLLCGHCRPCLQGHDEPCFSEAYTGITRPGVFAEYVALPVSAIWVHPPDIDLDIATLFEPLGNAVHAALQCELVGKAVIIFGASSEGLMAAAVCRHAGARQVVVVDQCVERLRLSLALGATYAINIDEDDIDEVRQGLGLSHGFDIALEMSGNPSVYFDVFSHVKSQGEIVLVGAPQDIVSMDWRSVIFKQLTVKGVNGRSMPETWQQMSSIIEGGLDLSPIITKRIHYTEFEEGFEALRRAQPGKIIMNWESK